MKVLGELQCRFKHPLMLQINIQYNVKFYEKITIQQF